jgi:guanyl-specific ribonuclease Sa
MNDRIRATPRTPSSSARTRLALIGLTLLGALLAWWLGLGGGSASAPTGSAPSAAPSRPPGVAPIPDHAPRPRRPAPMPPPTAAPDAAGLDLASIADPDERAAVVEVVRAIDAGTPSRYRQDGGVWQNREQRLPAEPRGYYREYTVRTPGEGDRGARRIIGGAQHELFYTRDHYRTFAPIRPARSGRE